MKHMPTTELTDLPKGIQRSRALPDPALGALWESIILDEEIKRRLLSQAVLNFTIRGQVDRGGALCVTVDTAQRQHRSTRIGAEQLVNGGLRQRRELLVGGELAKRVVVRKLFQAGRGEHVDHFGPRRLSANRQDTENDESGKRDADA